MGFLGNSFCWKSKDLLTRMGGRLEPRVLKAWAHQVIEDIGRRLYIL